MLRALSLSTVHCICFVGRVFELISNHSLCARVVAITIRCYKVITGCNMNHHGGLHTARSLPFVITSTSRGEAEYDNGTMFMLFLNEHPFGSRYSSLSLRLINSSYKVQDP